MEALRRATHLFGCRSARGRPTLQSRVVKSCQPTRYVTALALPAAVIVILLASAATVLTTEDVGGQLFHKIWTVREGLGPRFNAASCSACHAVSSDLSDPPPDLALVSLSASFVDPTGGHLLPRFRIDSDGSITGNPPPPISSRRRAPALFGLGALERVAVIRPGYGESSKDASIPSGRFGWKARYPTLEAAIAGALIAEMGLTTPQFHDPAVASPEVMREQVEAIAAFVRSLPAPRPQPLSYVAQLGSGVFAEVGCPVCHRADAPAGAMSLADVPHAYTDLSLHDL
jgi:hypothetical protein